MRKLVLIIPPNPWLISDTDLPALGPLFLSSFLKQKGYEVEVCDLCGIGEESWKIPIGDVYGVTGGSPNFPSMKKIVKRLKDREPHKLVLGGGFHVTCCPTQFLENTEADACVVGEGEYPLLHIMNGAPFKHIPGMYYKTDNGIKKTEVNPLIEHLDHLPLPDRDAIDFYKYSKSQIWKFLTGDNYEATVFTARGCPYKCNFCAAAGMWKRRVRYHSLDRVIYEIKHVQEKYGVGLIQFLDDTFVLNTKRVAEFCRRVKKLDVKWHCLNRVNRSDYDILKLMKDSGCVHCLYGFESGSDSILKAMDKKATVKTALKAAETAASLGYIIRGQLIVGFPGETYETIEETAKFIKEMKKYNVVFGLHVFVPYPGCDVWNRSDYYYEKYGYVVDKETDFSDYYFIGKPGMRFFGTDLVWEWYNYLKDIIGKDTIELQEYKG